MNHEVANRVAAVATVVSHQGRASAEWPAGVPVRILRSARAQRRLRDSIVGAALATLRRTSTGGVWSPLRAGSALHSHATIADNAWTMIDYPTAIRDENTGQGISKTEAAEIPVTALSLCLLSSLRRHDTSRLN